MLKIKSAFRCLAWIMVLLSVSYIWFGCHKKEEKVIHTMSEFPGEYHGNISAYKHGTMVSREIYLTVCGVNDNTKLQGIMYSGDIHVLSPTVFSEGIFYFRLICNDTLNDTCKNWSMAGYAFFNDAGGLEMRIAGNECGQVGDYYYKWEGALTRTSKEPDPERYFSFPQKGMVWNYRIMWDTYDTCTASRTLSNADLCEYTGSSNYPCLFPQTRPYKWTITPAAFIMEGDSLLNPCPITTVFRLDHKVNQTYQYVQGQDTMSLKCLSNGGTLQTPMGQTRYYMFERDCRFYANGLKYHYVSTYFLSPRLGILNIINYQFQYSYYVRNVDLDTITYSK